MNSDGKNQLRWAVAALVSVTVATAGDVFSLAFFRRYFPSYDPMTQPISALGANTSPISQQVSLWWIFLGIVFLFFAIAYRMNKSSNQTAFWLIVLYAVCEEIGSGVFPGNHLDSHLTPVGWAHNILGGIGVAALMVVPFVLIRHQPGQNHIGFNRFLKSISITGVTLFLLFSISRMPLPEVAFLRSWHGLWQRLFVANYYVVLVAIALLQVVAEARPAA